MDDRILIQKNLEMLIKTSGKTQAGIANAIGVNEATISMYLKGRAVPSTLLIKKLCLELNCTYEDILGSVD